MIPAAMIITRRLSQRLLGLNPRELLEFSTSKRVSGQAEQGIFVKVIFRAVWAK
jgi:hypothetical protein